MNFPVIISVPVRMLLFMIINGYCCHSVNPCFFLVFHFRLKTPRYKSVKPDGPMQRLKISKNVGISLEKGLFF